MKAKQIIYGLILLGIGMFIGSYFLGSGSPTNTTASEIHEQNTDQSAVYTCSMHPQIKQGEPGLCPICAMELIPLDVTSDNNDPTVLQMTSSAVALAQIETTVVGNSGGQQNQKTIPVEGVITLDERTIKTQTSHLGGRIEKMMVNFEGEYVSKGQLIATLYSTELLAASQELLTAVKYEDKVEGIVESAKQKLRNWKISDDKINQILSSGSAVTTINLYAEHGGYMINKMKSTGDYISPGSAFYTVATTGNVWAIFNVFESDIQYIKKGNEIRFTTNALGDQSFKSYVSYINPLLNSDTKTAEIRAEVKSQGKLKPGMLINGTISSVTSGDQQEILIPKTAILWTGKTSIAYVKIPDSPIPSFQFREVTLGESSGDYYLIKSGITSGEEVVTHGAFVIDASAQLNNNASMMHRNISVAKETSHSTPDYKQFRSEELDQIITELGVYYLSLKNTLTESDQEMAASSAKQLYKFVSDSLLDNKLLSGLPEPQVFLMEQLKLIKNHSQSISNDNNIEFQRANFISLSESMIELLTAFGTDDHTYYIQYCPMVDNNRGADWISTEKEIRNPYFGDRMMTCGSIKQEISQ